MCPLCFVSGLWLSALAMDSLGLLGLVRLVSLTPGLFTTWFGDRSGSALDGAFLPKTGRLSAAGQRTNGVRPQTANSATAANGRRAQSAEALTSGEVPSLKATNPGAQANVRASGRTTLQERPLALSNP